MRTTRSFAYGAALALAFTSTRTVHASPASPEIFVFGVAPTNTSSQFVDQAHFTYIPVIGPWLEIGKSGATAALVFDGVCQDVAGLAFLSGVLAVARAEPRFAAAWHFTPWFPQSGGGGLSVKANF